MHVHRDYIDLLPPHERALITEAIATKDATTWKNFLWNVIGISTSKSGATFERWLRFDEDPHPLFSSSLTFKGYWDTAPRVYTSDNRILHYKELLVGPNHPGYDLWKELSKDEKKAGLYEGEHAWNIGRLTYWEALLDAMGLQIVNYQLQLKNGTLFRLRP